MSFVAINSKSHPHLLVFDRKKNDHCKNQGCLDLDCGLGKI